MPDDSPASKTHTILDQLRAEATQAAQQSGQALASFAWLWPFKGVLFSLSHPHLILSVRSTLLTSLLTSALTFIALALATYVPQATLFSLFTGPILGPILALLLLGAESIFLLTVFARALFLEPALTHLFDQTLIASGHASLVTSGKSRLGADASGAGVGSRKEALENTLIRPFQALSSDGVVKYLLSLPLNLIPVLGTAAFLFLNGQSAGPGWHNRYFQLKGWDKPQKAKWVEEKRAAYTAFGMTTLLFTFIPLVGLLFSFTNTVGAALWAADIEAREKNITNSPSPSSSSEAPSATGSSNLESSKPGGGSVGEGDVATVEDMKKSQ